MQKSILSAGRETRYKDVVQKNNKLVAVAGAVRTAAEVLSSRVPLADPGAPRALGGTADVPVAAPRRLRRDRALLRNAEGQRR